MSGERWVAVVGFEGLYEVSDQGRVRSLDRWLPHNHGEGRWMRGQVLNPSVNHARGGYLQLHLAGGGRRASKAVHLIVAHAFLGPPPPGMQAAHENGRVMDCRLANLSYKTPAQNCEDKIRHGTLRFGEAHYKARFKESDVQAIRRLAKTGATSAGLAALYGVRPNYIWRIVSRDIWKQTREPALEPELLPGLVALGDVIERLVTDLERRRRDDGSL
jgi:hypothetical protein